MAGTKAIVQYAQLASSISSRYGQNGLRQTKPRNKRHRLRLLDGGDTNGAAPSSVLRNSGRGAQLHARRQAAPYVSTTIEPPNTPIGKGVGDLVGSAAIPRSRTYRCGKAPAGTEPRHSQTDRGLASRGPPPGPRRNRTHPRRVDRLLLPSSDYEMSFRDQGALSQPYDCPRIGCHQHAATDCLAAHRARRCRYRVDAG